MTTDRGRWGADVDEQLIAIPERRAAQLAGISLRRMRNWATVGLVTPSVTHDFGPRSRVRLYSFQDMIELLVAAEMTRRGRHMPQIRRLVERLRTQDQIEAPLRELQFAVLGREIFFRHPDGQWEGDKHPGQFPITEVLHLDVIRAQIHDATRRRPEQAGQVVRRRGVKGSKPIFAGTRIPVEAVVHYLEDGCDTAEVLAEYPDLTEADVEYARRSMAAAG